MAHFVLQYFLDSRHGMYLHNRIRIRLGLMSRRQNLWYNSVYWLNNAEIWTAWPSREMSGSFKWYYLVQLAFWIQQILVIHIEARRKDHAQMLTHHIITCTLISITYVYRYTRAANVVLCLMDLVDLLLPVSSHELSNM
jgi:acyl-CoA-dependent ceramide synthase